MTDQHWGPTISGDIVVIGGGSAGIGLLASLLAVWSTGAAQAQSTPPSCSRPCAAAMATPRPSTPGTA